MRLDRYLYAASVAISREPVTSVNARGSQSHPSNLALRDVSATWPSRVFAIAFHFQPCLRVHAISGPCASCSWLNEWRRNWTNVADWYFAPRTCSRPKRIAAACDLYAYRYPSLATLPWMLLWNLQPICLGSFLLAWIRGLNFTSSCDPGSPLS